MTQGCRKQYALINRETKILFLIFIYFLYYIYCCFLSVVYLDINILNLSLSEQFNLYLLNRKIISPIISTKQTEEFTYLRDNINVVIAGLLRNGEDTLSDLLQQVEILACVFHEAHIIIFESNSDDSTPLILQQWIMTTNNYNIHKDNEYIKSGDKTCHYTLNKSIHITLFQPEKELINVRRIYQLYRIGQIRDFRHKMNSEDIRIRRYIEYRNWMLHYIENNYINIDHLIWIDFDLVGFDIYNLLTEFEHILKYKDRNKQYYHVLCGDSLMANGWYYDSYPMIFEDDSWSYLEYHRSTIANTINSKRFYPMKSCFGGVAIYDYKTLRESQCKYEYIPDALDKLSNMKEWFNKYSLPFHEVCEHIAMNYCLREYGANIAVSSLSNVYYGADNKHGKSSDNSFWVQH